MEVGYLELMQKDSTIFYKLLLNGDTLGHLDSQDAKTLIKCNLERFFYVSYN